MDNRSNSRLFARLSCLGLLVLSIAACGGKNKGKTTEKLMNSEEDEAVKPKVDTTLCDTKDKKITTSDLDRDRRPDVWRLYTTVKEGETTVEYLSCRQTDYDRDGRKDYVVAFTRKGAKSFEKFDYDYDGTFDAFHQYDPKSGRLFEIQRETGFDGRYDITEVYDENEQLKAVKHDRNADGEPDMWEQWVEGRLAAILYDDDYDSKVDRRDERKLETQPTKPSPGNDTASGETDPATDSTDETDPSAEPADKSADGAAATEPADKSADDAAATEPANKSAGGQ